MSTIAQLYLKSGSTIIVPLVASGIFDKLPAQQEPYIITKVLTDSIPVIYPQMTDVEKIICLAEFYDSNLIQDTDFNPPGEDRLFKLSDKVSLVGYDNTSLLDKLNQINNNLITLVSPLSPYTGTLVANFWWYRKPAGLGYNFSNFVPYTTNGVCDTGDLFAGTKYVKKIIVEFQTTATVLNPVVQVLIQKKTGLTPHVFRSDWSQSGRIVYDLEEFTAMTDLSVSIYRHQSQAVAPDESRINITIIYHD